MKQLILISFLIYSFADLLAQSQFKLYQKYEIAELGKTFEMGQILYPELEIMLSGTGKYYYEEKGTSPGAMTKSKPVNMTIRIIDQDGSVKSIEVPYNDIAIDMSGFYIHYTGIRNFLVFTAGRHHFYILNISSNKIIGPLQPQLEGEASDSQDGTLSFSQVFSEGQYLMGHAHNFGAFCYNLLDLYHPIQVRHLCKDTQHMHEQYFFLDHRRDNIYNGLIFPGNRQSNNDAARFLFRGWRLSQKEDGAPLVEILDKRYLYLHRITEDGEKEVVKIDYKNSEIEAK